MKLHLNKSDGINLITASGDGFVAVNGEEYRASLIVLPDRVIADWPARDAESLCPSDFDSVIAANPDVLVFGSGGKFALAQGEWLIRFAAAGIGVETMDTRAACRTYNILAADGRAVAAALIV